MPTYSFHNTATDEYFEEYMSISSREEYLNNNPHITVVITAPNIVAGVSSGMRVDNGFKEVLSKVAEAHPNSAVGQQYGRNNTKQAKTAEIAKKYGIGG